MALPTLATLLLSASLWQESVVPPEARLPLPHPVANAPIATVNDNRRPAGTRVSGTPSLSLDIVEAGYQPEGEHDPVVRILAFAETGKAPSVPGPLLRAGVVPRRPRLSRVAPLRRRRRSTPPLTVSPTSPSVPR